MNGKSLRAIRIKKGMTQKNLANIMGYKTAQYVSNWERGEADPPLEHASLLAKTLGISKKDYKQSLITQYEKKIDKILNFKKA